MHVDLLIIGGGPAALSAAVGYRHNGGNGQVLLVGEEDTPPYARPPLSKDYLRGETVEADLALEPVSRYAELEVVTRLGRAVNALNVAERQATLADGEPVSYRTCLLATGAEPRRPPVPGADDPGLRYLRSLEGARRLRASAAEASSALVVGCGFIACEAAASLARLGLTVTMIGPETAPQLTRLGVQAGRRIAGWLHEENVTLINEVSITAIEGSHRVHTDDQRSISADLILVATGIIPRSELARQAGAVIHNDRVVVDEHMRSTVPGLLAAGDVAYPRNAAAGRHLVVEHWGDALAMGAVAGATAAGTDAYWRQAPGFWSTIGEHTLKLVGWGDGYEDASFDDHGDGSFTIWYTSEGVVLGVATHDADADYELGRELVEQHGRPTRGRCHPEPNAREGESRSAS